MRKSNSIILITLLGLFLLVAVAPVLADEPVPALQKELEYLLVCQDGCGMLVGACDNATAAAMRKKIVEQLAVGKSKNEVLQYFVDVYGPKVLSAPKPEGFNLTAWIVPFLAVIGGGIFIYFALDKWVFINRLEKNLAENEENQPVQNTPENLEEYQEILDEELKRYL